MPWPLPTGIRVERFLGARRMPLYELSDEGLIPRSPSGFAELGLYERADLQRLLRDDISVLGPDLRVLAEEFG